MTRVVTWRRHAIVAVLMLTGADVYAQAAAIAPELWDRPRSGTAVMGEPAIQQAVRAYLARPGARLVIHHAAGQEPGLYAEELRSWLIALAIDAEHVQVRGDLARGDPLKIEIVQ